ncbi:MAG: hypothetical protein ACLS43_06470 [Evtepia gabavorous]
MKKRIFALFLSALLLTTVLCACGDEKSEEAGGIGSNGTSSSESRSPAVSWWSEFLKTWETVLTRIR